MVPPARQPPRPPNGIRGGNIAAIDPPSAAPAAQPGRAVPKKPPIAGFASGGPTGAAAGGGAALIPGGPGGGLAGMGAGAAEGGAGGAVIARWYWSTKELPGGAPSRPPRSVGWSACAPGSPLPPSVLNP